MNNNDTKKFPDIIFKLLTIYGAFAFLLFLTGLILPIVLASIRSAEENRIFFSKYWWIIVLSVFSIMHAHLIWIPWVYIFHYRSLLRPLNKRRQRIQFIHFSKIYKVCKVLIKPIVNNYDFIKEANKNLDLFDDDQQEWLKNKS